MAVNTGINLDELKQKELYDYAKQLGLKPAGGLTKDDLKATILEALEKGATPEKNGLEKNGRVYLTIMESSDKNAENPVFVGVQGVGYTIKRGVEVLVPRAVIHALGNARQVVFDATNDQRGAMTLHPREALSYPFTVREP